MVHGRQNSYYLRLSLSCKSSADIEVGARFLLVKKYRLAPLKLFTVNTSKNK
jgi:hypothetical protein